MIYRAFSSLRVRLLALVLLAVLPAVGLVLVTGAELRDAAAAQIRTTALRFARLAADRQRHTIEDTRQLLIALAQHPDVRQHGPAACSSILRDRLGQYSVFTNLIVDDADGNVICSAVPLAGPVNHADREWFQQAVESGDFATSRYQIGRITGKPSLAAGYPVYDDSGRTQAVVAAALDLGWLNRLAAEAELPAGSTVTIFDRDGVVLARYPEPERWVGQTVGNVPIVRAALAPPVEGTTDAVGLDGARELFGFTPIGRPPGPEVAFVAVGVPTSALAPLDNMLERNLSALAVVMLLALGAAWIGGDLFVRRPVRAVIAAAQRLSRGELETRTGRSNDQGELGELSRAFDTMATAVETRQSEASQRTLEIEALLETARHIGASLDLDPVFATVLRAAGQICATNRVAIFCLDDAGSFTCPAADGLSHGFLDVVRRFATAQARAAPAPLSALPIIVDDIPPAPELDSGLTEALRAERIRATLVMPMLRHDKNVGALAIFHDEPHPYPDDELQLVRALASQAAGAIDNARLHQSVQERAREVEVLLAATKQIVASFDLMATLDTVLDSAVGLTGASVAAAALLDSSGARLRYESARGMHAAWLAGLEFRATEGVLGATLHAGRSVNIPDVTLDGRWVRPDTLAASGIRSALLVPLLGRQRAIGVLVVMSQEPAFFIPARERMLAGLADQAALAIEHARQTTERERAEEQLRQAQKMEAIGRLAGGVAHDFNNLLTIITGFGELLLPGFDVKDPRRGFVEEINKAGESAIRVTRQLLAFSRQQVLQPKDLDLNALVAGLEKMLGRLIGEDIELIAELDPALGLVRADPGLIEQVIMNLAVNARDAMPRGGRLLFETRNGELDEEYARLHPGVRPGPYVVLAMADTGVGMDAATQARIFDPFFTTKEPGKGTGLGLSTVFGIVEQSGGHIAVYSEVGRGATFRVYLPRLEEAGARSKAQRRRGRVATGSETILVVEDEPTVRLLACKLLRASGYVVIEAEHGEAALALAETYDGPIDLLITDLVMPGLSGREVAEQLARLRPSTRVLYMSGYTDDAVIRHGPLSPGTAFLQKPFTMTALTQQVREVLDARGT